MKSHKMCAHSLYGELFRGGKVDRQSGRFSPRGWQEKSVQMARLRRNIQPTQRQQLESPYSLVSGMIELPRK